MKSKMRFWNQTSTAVESAETVETVETVGQRIPGYYIGKVYGYEARKVVEDWNLSYNVGTATTYLLRCGKKKEQGMSDNAKHIEDINKAINHLKFEIEKLINEK
tara:strand:- start:288 stop:599 length:312 start_codon:yes stop_codon:yes gene_type:complete